MRNIVMGADGTWNKPDQVDRQRQVPSNVVKAVRAVMDKSPQIEQLWYYDTGVGTAGLVDKLWGGMAGNGLFGNMRKAYAWLLTHYQPDDRLFLFGFSRGAFTVRSLAGMQAGCGIPPCILMSVAVMPMRGCQIRRCCGCWRPPVVMACNWIRTT